jgi:hypothetical protein
MNRKPPKNYYYQSLHTCEDGKDIYLHVIYEQEYSHTELIDLIYEPQMSWNCTIPRIKMISFTNSGRQQEFEEFIHEHELQKNILYSKKKSH